MADIAQLGVEVKPSGIVETTNQLRTLSTSAKSTEDSFGSLALKIAGYSTLANVAIDLTRKAVSEMAAMGKEAVVLAASFERSRMAWGVLMRDVSAGSAMFDKLYGLAQRTPLSFQGVESAAQMLKGFGLATAEIIPTLERMGDVARGNDETMQRLALAYGQALAQGRVLTRDLYQFVNAGVPIFDALATVMGKTVAEVQQLVTDGKVGFPQIESALKALTGQGGQFFEMMEKTATTTEGKWSIAMDNWRAILANIGTDVLPALNRGLDAFNESADRALAKRNVLAVVNNSGGSPEAAKAYLERERATLLAQKAEGKVYTDPTWWESFGLGLLGNAAVPGTSTLTIAARLAEIEAQLGLVQTSALERQRLSGSMGAPMPTSAIPTPSDSPWRTSLSDVTGISANNFRLDDEGKWNLPTAEVVVNEYIASLERDYSTPIVIKMLEASYKKLLTMPGKFVPTDNSLMAISQALARLEMVGNELPKDSIFTAMPYYTSGSNYADRWAGLPGGGIPYLSGLNIPAAESMYRPMLDYAGSGAYRDRWAGLPGGGVPYLTPAQAASYFDISGFGEMPSYGFVPGEYERNRAAREAARNAAVNAFYRNTMETWRTEASSNYGAGDDFAARPYSPSTFFMLDREPFNADDSLQIGRVAALRLTTAEIERQAESLKITESAWDSMAQAAIRATSQELVSGFEAIGEALAGGTDAAQNFEDASAQIIRQLAESLPTLMLEAGLRGVILNPSNPVAWALIALGLGGAAAWGAAQGAASNSSTSTVEANALGNVYGASGLKRYENGVYNTPQYFAFAKGGVFGEAGYEAIMPLARSASGALGVRAQSAPVNIQINNNVGASISTEETTDENGEKKLILHIEKMVKGMAASGKLDNALASRYGTRVAAAQRM